MFPINKETYPISFDLGAQGQRIRELGIGTVLDPILIQNPAALFDAILGIKKIGDFKIENQIGYLSYKMYYEKI